MMRVGGVLGWYKAKQQLETKAFTIFKDCRHTTGVNG